jgi:hypothetical protein
MCSVQITVASQDDGQRKAAPAAPGPGPVQFEDPAWALEEPGPPEVEEAYSFFDPGLGFDEED